jgi:hypothetical protein
MLPPLPNTEDKEEKLKQQTMSSISTVENKNVAFGDKHERKPLHLCKPKDTLLNTPAAWTNMPKGYG